MDEGNCKKNLKAWAKFISANGYINLSCGIAYITHRIHKIR